MAELSGDRRIDFSVAAGERVYAIGDIHGCTQAFEQLIHSVRLDTQARGATLTRIVLLGDVVDRGPDPARLLRSVMALQASSERFIVLMGNHEQLMIKALNGDEEAMALWLNVGGDATLLTFGVDKALVREGASSRLAAAAQRAVGVKIVAWLSSLPLSYRSGQILFVHAGVRPGVPLEKQSPEDLLWIREPFLSAEEDRPFLVVHGHSISSEGASWGRNRVGIDTGAYETGRLTALGLEGSHAWSLST